MRDCFFASFLTAQIGSAHEASVWARLMRRKHRTVGPEELPSWVSKLAVRFYPDTRANLLPSRNYTPQNYSSLSWNSSSVGVKWSVFVMK